MKEPLKKSAPRKLSHRIVVGVDGSHSSVATLEWAAQQAELTRSSLEVLITWEWPVIGFGDVTLPSDDDPARDAATSLREVLQVVQPDYPDVVMHPSVHEGRPGPILVDAAREADLLVVGTHGRSELSSLLLGSVSETCAHHASCPVVIIRDEAPI